MTAWTARVTWATPAERGADDAVTAGAPLRSACDQRRSQESRSKVSVRRTAANG